MVLPQSVPSAVYRSLSFDNSHAEEDAKRACGDVIQPQPVEQHQREEGKNGRYEEGNQEEGLLISLSLLSSTAEGS